VGEIILKIKHVIQVICISFNNGFEKKILLLIDNFEKKNFQEKNELISRRIKKK